MALQLNSDDMRILLVSFFNPLEPNSGSGLRSNCLLKNLGNLGYIVHLFSFSQSDNSSRLKDYPFVEKACFVPRLPRPGLLALLKSILFLQPLAISHFITSDVKKSFVKLTSGESYDAIIFDYIYMFALRKYLQTAKICKITINEHNSEFVMARETYKKQKKLHLVLIWFIDYLLLKRYELNALRSADCVVHVTELDRQNYSGDIKNKSVVIPNTLPYRKEYEVKRDLEKNVVFVGSMAHYANVEGIIRFIQEAWIDIFNLRRNINLQIVGGNPPHDIQKYDGKYNIQVLGYVDNLAEIYEKASIAITPINIGSGSRLKIVEAMMNGTLNIASPKGAEGLQVEDGRHIVIAEGKQAWIDKIIYYLDNKHERTVIEKNAHDLVQKQYFYENYKQVLKQCVNR